MTLEYTPLEQIDSKVASVRNGFNSGITLDVKFRKEQLGKLYASVKYHEEELKQALRHDIHRSGAESEILELNAVTAEISLAINSLDKWAADEALPFDLTIAHGRPYLRKTPYGVVLIQGPWNYPYLCLIVPLVSAIAAGNTVVVKPTEVAWNSTSVVKKVLSVLNSQVCQCIVGGVEHSTKLLNMNWDKIMLTGSCGVGKVVAHAAAEQLTPITLELGGKSPVLVTRNADIDLVARRVAWGKLINAGQTCIAPDYVIIDEEVAENFVTKYTAAVHQLYPNLNANSPDYAHLVTTRHFDRAMDLVRNTAGRVEQLGIPDRESKFFPPTLAVGVTINDSLMKDELFNPILPLMIVQDVLQEGSCIVRRNDHPLALYVMTKSTSEANRLISQTRSGAVCVNDCVIQGASCSFPFGGVGSSGVGRYHGKFGFDEFSFERPVLNQPSWAEVLLNFRYPPYKSSKVAIVRLLYRHLSVLSLRQSNLKSRLWKLLIFLLPLIAGIYLARQ